MSDKTRTYIFTTDSYKLADSILKKITYLNSLFFTGFKETLEKEKIHFIIKGEETKEDEEKQTIELSEQAYIEFQIIFKYLSHGHFDMTNFFAIPSIFDKYGIDSDYKSKMEKIFFKNINVLELEKNFKKLLENILRFDDSNNMLVLSNSDISHEQETRFNDLFENRSPSTVLLKIIIFEYFTPFLTQIPIRNDPRKKVLKFICKVLIDIISDKISKNNNIYDKVLAIGANISYFTMFNELSVADNDIRFLEKLVFYFMVNGRKEVRPSEFMDVIIPIGDLKETDKYIFVINGTHENVKNIEIKSEDLNKPSEPSERKVHSFDSFGRGFYEVKKDGEKKSKKKKTSTKRKSKKKKSIKKKSKRKSKSKKRK